MSEATCLGYIRRFYDALEPWETAAKEHLLTRRALHADKAGFGVNKKTQWLQAITDGSLKLKFLHRKRGKDAIDFFGIIRVYTDVLVHDCWASYFAYFQHKHQVCDTNERMR